MNHDHGLHLMTCSVSSIYFLSIHLIFYSWSWISSASYLPFGFSAKLAISWTAFKTVGLSSESNFTILSKGQWVNIYIFPWFNWAREQRRRVEASLTFLSLWVIKGQISLIHPLAIIDYFPYSLKDMLAKVIQTLYCIWILR